jgi:hypothetical protein
MSVPIAFTLSDYKRYSFVHSMKKATMLKLVLYFVIGGVGLDRVHLVHWSVVGMSYQPQMMDECGMIIGR